MLNPYRIHIKDQPIGFTVYATSCELDDDLLIFSIEGISRYTTLILTKIVDCVRDQNTGEIIYQTPLTTASV